MDKKLKFLDNFRNIFNFLSNKRSTYNQVAPVAQDRLSDAECEALSQQGLARTGISIYANDALNDIIKDVENEKIRLLQTKLINHTRNAIKKMLAFGTSYLVLIDKHQSSSEPLSSTNNILVYLFAGESEITPVFDRMAYNLSSNFYDVEFYLAMGLKVHHTRIIKFTYEKPRIREAYNYHLGGISLMQYVLHRLIDDYELPKNSIDAIKKINNIYYKMHGLKEQLRLEEGKEKVLNQIGAIEDARSQYSAVIIDKDDEVGSFQQTLSGIDGIMLQHIKRSALHFNIPVPVLLGEKTISGLGDNNDGSLRVWSNTVNTFRETYVLEPMNKLFNLFNLELPNFTPHNFETKKDILTNHALALDNANKMRMNSVSDRYIESYLKDHISQDVTIDDVLDDYDEQPDEIKKDENI